MSNKFGFFRIPLTLEKVYTTSLEFWRNNNGKIIEDEKTSEGLIKILNIQRGMSLTSNGEHYEMKFKFNEYEATTYVAIEVALSFGFGMQWLTPQKLIKQWGKQFDYYGSFDLIRNGDINAFFDFKKPPAIPIAIKKVEPEIILKATPQEEVKEEMSYIKPLNNIKQLSISDTPKVNIKYCTNCGAKASEDHRFCVICGHKLRD